jgi:hypothetical protein
MDGVTIAGKVSLYPLELRAGMIRYFERSVIRWKQASLKILADTTDLF